MQKFYTKKYHYLSHLHDLHEKLVTKKFGDMTFSHSHLPPYWKYSRAHAYNHILLLGQHDKHTSEPSDVVQISTKDLIPWKPKAIHITERTHKHITLIWDELDTHPVAAKHYEVQKRVYMRWWVDRGWVLR